jgi:hypothetical protein
LAIPRTGLDIIIDKNGTKPGVYSKSFIDPSIGAGTCGPAVPSTPADFAVFGGGQ